MMTILIEFLKSSIGKYIVIGLVFIVTVVYLNLQIQSLENTVDKLNITLERTKTDLKTVKTNLGTCTRVNTDNELTLNKYKQDMNRLKYSYEDTLDLKDETITKLKGIIVELKKPVIYPERIVMKECVLKIKRNNNEKDSIVNIISNIGN